MKVKFYYFKTLFLLIGFFLIAQNSYAKEYYADELFDRSNYKEKATFIILDKIRAKKTSLQIKKNVLTNFEDIKIIMHACWTNRSLQTDNRALIEILDTKNNNLFSGWIFSNSPSLSNIEHKVYFLKLKSCDE